jgi:hypothetical protein
MKPMHIRCPAAILTIFLTAVTARPLLAQQNLFNIPSGDLTPRGKFFFQHQTNFYSPTNTESKNHFVYGLGSGFEAGVNVVNLKIDWRNRYRNTDFLTVNNSDRSVPLKPLIQLTGQKFFFLGDKFKSTVGTQVGFSAVNLGGTRLTHFTYNTWVYEPKPHAKLVVGPYLTDRGTVGGGNNVGVLVGFEYPVHKRLLIMGDFISGNNATSVSVLGFNFLATNRLQLCLGALVPNPGSGNPAGVVFELNLLGFDDH